MTTLAMTDRGGVLGAWRAYHRADLPSHVAHHGALAIPPRADAAWPRRLADVMEEAGLAGRGGAAFPSATKLRRLQDKGREATVVVNAMEGEPASDKDKVLLTCVPHLVLDGASLVAAAIGARRIVICVPRERPDVTSAISRAIAERHGPQLAPVPFEVAQPPGRYVAGEESALVSWLGGGTGAPTFRLDKSVPLALGRGPALVYNAETVAHVALIWRRGAQWFRGIGTDDAGGISLVTVSGAVEHTGVYEVPMGTAVGDILDRAVPAEPVAAVLVGGYGGCWIPGAALATPFAPGPLAQLGASVGAGVLVVLPERACGIAETARVARYMAGESAGQCGPCVFGLPAVADDLERLAEGRDVAGVLFRMHHRVGEVAGRGACRHPDGVVRLVRSAMSVFATDAADHAAGRPCQHRRSRCLAVPVGGNRG